MQVTDYESIFAVGRQLAEPPRVLFFKNSLPKDHSDEQASRFHSGQGGELQAVMSVDTTLDKPGSFSDVLAEFERTEQDWHIVLLAALSERKGMVPSPAEAERPLEMMMNALEKGSALSKRAPRYRFVTGVKWPTRLVA